MNTRSAFLVRLICTLVIYSWALHGTAQGKNGELTKDFDKLSAKERSKIAAKETQEAAEDSEYQALMREADHAFQATHFEEALATYERARAMRPYNVYPKVKIQDLQALIKKRDLEKAAVEPSTMAEPETIEVQEVIQPASPDPAPVSQPTSEPVPAPPAAVVPASTTTTSPVSSPKPTVDTPTETPPEVTKPAVRTAPAPQSKPATVGERVYVEAGAVVTERTVEDDGKTVIYRKVVHAWGQTFFFKDGLTISQFQWDQRFTE